MTTLFLSTVYDFAIHVPPMAYSSPSSVAPSVVGLQGSQLETNSWTVSFCTLKQIFCY